MSDRCKVRPSEFVCIKDSWAAFCFDEAVIYFGGWIESKLTDFVDGKPKYSLEFLLAEPEDFEVASSFGIERLKALAESSSLQGFVSYRKVTTRKEEDVS